MKRLAWVLALVTLPSWACSSGGGSGGYTGSGAIGGSGATAGTGITDSGAGGSSGSDGGSGATAGTGITDSGAGGSAGGIGGSGGTSGTGSSDAGSSDGGWPPNCHPEPDIVCTVTHCPGIWLWPDAEICCATPHGPCGLDYKDGKGCIPCASPLAPDF
jgi:hypothetical protein